ncbi:MAG TPA: NUDIX hydrolase [Chryseolinea sp.]
MDAQISETYGHKVRVRACGLCWQGDRLLLVNHKMLRQGDFWAPPGGGVEVGESLEEALKREYREETGLLVDTPQFRFGCEFIQPPLHAIELFFEVTVTGGELKAGHDPELQLIADVKFMTPDEIQRLPAGALHGIFHLARTADDLRRLSGFYRI